MNKPYIRDVMTVLGILLTVLIFLGGWRITEELFSRSKDILLAEVMYSQVYKADITSMEENQPENQPEDSLETRKLSLEEMSEILKQCYPSDIDIFGNTQVTLADVGYIIWIILTNLLTIMIHFYAVTFFLFFLIKNSA